MNMPGRLFSSGSYRYGFNGKEKDDKDGVVQYDYGFRIYDPRLVRFKSVDPLTNKYPELTPYQFGSNRPIDGIDIDGLEWKKYLKYAISPLLFPVQDKDFREGFAQRASEFIHGLKNLPKVISEYLSAHTTALPGGAYLKQQETKRQNIETAIGQGGVEYAKEMFQLVKAAGKGDKKAAGALTFEAMVMVIPDVDAVRAFSVTGKFGKLLSVESKASISAIGRLEGAIKEIAIETRNGTRADALRIASELTGGGIPENATLIYGKQGILKNMPVGYKWKGEDGVFKIIRLDHDDKIGAHINITAGKDKFSIPFKASENQVRQIGTNEIMKEIKK